MTTVQADSGAFSGRVAGQGRLTQTFARLRAAGTPGLVTYVTAGDPDLRRTEGILQALDRAGADVLEVGVPFSDPLADGPVIQRATERALASGTTLRGVLDMLTAVRPGISAPILISHCAAPTPSSSAALPISSARLRPRDDRWKALRSMRWTRSGTRRRRKNRLQATRGTASKR